MNLERLFYPHQITKSLNCVRLMNVRLRSELCDSFGFTLSEVFKDIKRESYNVSLQFVYDLSRDTEQLKFLHEIFNYKKAEQRLSDLNELIAGFPARIASGNLTQEDVDKTKQYYTREIANLERDIERCKSSISLNNPHPISYIDLGFIYFRCPELQYYDDDVAKFTVNGENYYKAPLYELEFIDGYKRKVFNNSDTEISGNNIVIKYIDDSDYYTDITRTYYAIVSENEFKSKQPN